MTETTTETTETNPALPKLTREMAYAMRGHLGELERLEGHFANVRDMAGEDGCGYMTWQEMIGELANYMGDDEAEALAKTLHAQAITRARGACQRKAAEIGFVWEEPAADDDEIEIEDDEVETSCGCTAAA